MKKRRDLPPSQLYESIYAPAQLKKSDKDEQLKIAFIKKEQKKLQKDLHGYQGRIRRLILKYWYYCTRYLIEEWVLFAIVGIIVACISYGMDKGAALLNGSRIWLYNDLAYTPAGKYFAWISIPICTCMFSAGFVKVVGPAAAGSGIPQIKTILRGVYLDNFLTFRVLIAKVMGLTSTMGSNMPLGKEGPLIHISTCCTTLLVKLTNYTNRIFYQNQLRKIEILAAACAIGVACTFASPIGGVLLSIEITTSYYAVRNYWRGFYGAIWAATFYRLLYVWIEGFETISVVFKTNIFVETPFAAQELFAFAVLGVICGLGGALYMRVRIEFNKSMNNNKFIKTIKNINFFIYPFLISLIVSSISFPLGIGKYMASHLQYGPQVVQLFSNFTWTNTNLSVTQQAIVNNWQTKHTSVYLHIVCFIAFNFFCSILSSTMPIPNGCFIPTFRMGAGIGRIVGELMYSWYPNGLSYFGRITRILPGGYAIVGAAAFSGAVTHTMSVAVIILEMTSQITHTIPILISVLIANCIAQNLTPSIYNSVIKSKKLPYLPDLLPNNSAYYSVYVEDFMVKDIKFIYHGMIYKELKELLLNNDKLTNFPLVNNPTKRILLGSVQRNELIRLIEKQIGKERRLQLLTSDEEINLKNSDDKDGEFIENPLYIKPEMPTKNKLRICDLSPQSQKQWELKQMQSEINFDLCQIDPAPFQLVERTSLLKVHTLFSMIGINIAYVTSLGRLIGVVGLKDLRKAIEDVNCGNLKGHNLEIIITADNVDDHNNKENK